MTYRHDSCIYYLIQIINGFLDETLRVEVWTKWENVTLPLSQLELFQETTGVNIWKITEVISLIFGN